MESVTITPMPGFSPDAKLGTSIATRWNNRQTDFEIYLTASRITDPKRKRALLLYQAGPRVREIFRQIPDTLRDPKFDLKSMFIVGRRDKQSTYQAKQIESKEPTDGETKKLEQQPRCK